MEVLKLMEFWSVWSRAPILILELLELLEFLKFDGILDFDILFLDES